MMDTLFNEQDNEQQNQITKVIKRQYEEEDIIQIEMNNFTNTSKRSRDEIDTDWTVVERKEKKIKERDNIELYISWKEKLPKQFALAKLLKAEGIKDIVHLKYINQYKVRIDLVNANSATKLETCKTFVDKGWRFRRAMEVTNSYGVIKNVDLDMSDEEICEAIFCPRDVEIVSANRLKKRNFDKKTSEDSWIPSEAVKLCFKGSSVPTYVVVDDLRIKVDPYVFPVTQCIRCWKFGHTMKTCTSKNQICPKCSGEHDNCETQTYKCVNCCGSHMALVKSCPVFVKEKKIRDLMAEFNCTYRKALLLYVPPDSPTDGRREPVSSPKFSTVEVSTTPAGSIVLPTFSDVVKTETAIHQAKSQKYFTNFRQKRSQRPNTPVFDTVSNLEPIPSDNSSYPNNYPNATPNQNKVRDVNFKELLTRLKEIIFLKDASMQAKIYDVIKCCVEWVILVVVDNIADWPILKNILDFING